MNKTARHKRPRRILWSEAAQGQEQVPVYLPVTVILRKVDILSNFGRWDEAEVLGRRTLERGRELGLDAAVAESGFRLGEILRFRGEYDGSLEFLSLSADLFRAIADGGGLARSIGAMGGVHGERGDFQKAIDCFSRRRAWAEEAGDRMEQGISWGNLGVMYAEQRMYDRAMECYGHQRRLAEECGDLMGVALATGNTGNIHLYRGEYGRAVECFRAQRGMATRLGDKRSLCALACNLGLLYKRQARLDEARACFEEAIGLSREIGFARALSISTGNLGAVHQQLGNWEPAARHIEEYLRLSRELGDRAGEASALANLSRLHAVAGRDAQAADMAARAVAVAREGELAALLPVLLNMQADMTLEGPGWESASPLLEESSRLARERDNAEQGDIARMLSAVFRLRRGGQDAAGELTRIAAGNFADQARLGARFWLYRSTGDPVHLEEARLLTEDLYSKSGDIELQINLKKLEASMKRAPE